jgi:hypothetical protein
MTRRHLELDMARQPDETTCGPTCLQAVYRYLGDDVPLDRIVEEVPVLSGGGTLAVFLACHALKRGYRATLYPYNLNLFDPTWFDLDRYALAERLYLQVQYRQGSKVQLATRAFLDYLELGGELRFVDLSPRLIRRLLDGGLPVLAGLSATYLYREAREIGLSQHDDVRGEPAGHFVVLSGYEERARRVLVADPLHPNPLGPDGFYAVSADRLLTAILLGVLTYDANLLQIEPAP